MKIINITTALVTLLLLSCGKNQEKENTQKDTEKAILVEVSQKEYPQEVDENTFRINGKIESSRTSNLSPKIMGRIIKMNIKEGEKVKAGQVIAIINSDDLQAQKSQANAGISEAQSAYDNALINFNRFKKLYEQQSATKFEYDNAKMQLDMAKSKVEQAQSNKRQINTMIREASITAPFSGVITKKYTEEGGLASPGMPVVTIESTGDLVIRAMVPENEISNIKQGQEVSVLLNSLSKTITGKIALINSSSQFTGSQYEVEIKLDVSPEVRSLLKSGMYADILVKRLFPSEKKSNTTNVRVLKKFIVEKGQLKGIYTVSDDNHAILRWIQVGKDYGDSYEVISGLNPNEKYITTADGKLYNRAKVKIK
ncbi:MAG: efflux RND transporter periplasmic adaptor subunit [Flavobacteriales bacterium]|nr:efflux RND transporter periplasmic adaptor subunit [Flavobacteriales bacterium]